MQRYLLTLLTALVLAAPNLARAVYDPVSGRFLSFDPLGHAASPDGYSFCNGDPVNNFDPDGRCFRGFNAGLSDARRSSDENSAFGAGYYFGGILAGTSEGLEGGRDITFNTLSFGGTDAAGWTTSGQFQGGDYTASRVLATVGRESLIGAATLGSFQLARGGSEAALYSYQGLQVVNAGRSGWAIGTGLDQVSQGNNWGYLSIAGGTLGLAGGFTMTATAPELNNLNVVQNQIFSSAARNLPTMNFSTPQDSAVFYSGPGNRQLALSYADSAGATPIDYTSGGVRLNQLDLYNSVSRAQANYIWSQASASYASQASGAINLFVEGALPGRIFSTVESPILQGNPAVTDWIFHPSLTPVPAR